MSNFLLEQIIIKRKLIFRPFKLILHYDSYPFETLQLFIIVNEIVYKCDKKVFICNVVFFIKLAVPNEYFFIVTNNINWNRNNSLL
jgi:hypothetical protein